MKKQHDIFYLDVTRIADSLKISAYEQSPGEATTARHYEETPAPMALIGSRCREMAEALNKAGRQGRMDLNCLEKLKNIGQLLSDDLLPYTIKDKIRNTKASHLILTLDDEVVHIPWELFHDGNQFLCRRFSMGRIVRTRQNIQAGKTRTLNLPLKMLILADPRGDLNGAYAEGIQLRDHLDPKRGSLNVSLRAAGITSTFIRENIRNFDVVHYAGHCDYDAQHPNQSGWRLSGEWFRAQEIMRMAGTDSMPALIFSNACQSARTEEWSVKSLSIDQLSMGSSFNHDEVFGLANAFILSGVKHYVGTLWEILDEPGRRFALEFYDHMLSGYSLGESVRDARESLVKAYGEETVVWASYVLYGDPSFNYIGQKEEKPQTAKTTVISAPAGTRIRAAGDKNGNTGKRKNRSCWLGLSAGIIAFIVVLFWGYQWILTNNALEYEKIALASYNEGKFEESLKACKNLEDKNPDGRLPHLIRGDIYLRKGDSESAINEYQYAIQAPKGTDKEKASAFMGMGRIASLENQKDTALEYYRQASSIAPQMDSAYIAQGALMEDIGNYKQALQFYIKAKNLSPDNVLLAAIISDINHKIDILENEQQQARINKMVNDLLERMDEKDQNYTDKKFDSWTSFPLTLWIMDFQEDGSSLQEAQARLLNAGISARLIQDDRIRIVERALLDKLLEELKLGTSRLADPGTALSVGRIIAARLILAGKIIYSSSHTQVFLRLIETETGQITAAITENFGCDGFTSGITDKISEDLLQKIYNCYPLRGKISSIDKDIVINIGENLGVALGQQFRVIDEDIMLEVLSVMPDKSLVKIISGENMLQIGQNIESGRKKL